MAFDFKKEYKEFYMPKNKPGIVTVPPMNYIAVRGKGDPNTEDGEYKQAINMLYGIAFTIKMSKLGDRRIEGYFDYVVPPLEGFWWQDGVLDLRDPPAGLRDRGRLQMGRRGSDEEKESRLLESGVPDLR